MNIADGEYNIDLSVLQGTSSDSEVENSSLAIRYGFIPDSMDQSSPLHLYQGDQICILEALSTEKLKQTEALPIIFEGVPQRQRPQAAVSAPNDSYYLSFSPASGSRKEVGVALKKLGSTIRVSKSRNAEKWRASIREWRENPTLHGDLEAPQGRPAPSKAPHITAKPASNEFLKKATDSKRSAPKSALKSTRSASKRPPKRNPESNEIISVSDFEDLSDDDSQLRSPDPKQKTVSTGPSGKKVPVVTTKNDHDMDDEWADLEDQLEEVLESGQTTKPAQPTDSEDDELNLDDDFEGGPIIIDVKDEKPSKEPLMPRFGGQRTPMSLRQLHGSSEANDYLSSSEEE